MPNTETKTNEQPTEQGVPSGDLLALPADVKEFIYSITLRLQKWRGLTPQQMDGMFSDAYRLYQIYKVESR